MLLQRIENATNHGQDELNCYATVSKALFRLNISMEKKISTYSHTYYALEAIKDNM